MTVKTKREERREKREERREKREERREKREERKPTSEAADGEGSGEHNRYTPYIQVRTEAEPTNFLPKLESVP